MEKRSAPRFQTNIPGTLFFDTVSGRGDIGCNIVDLSDGGARVETVLGDILPLRVALHECSHGNIYDCEVRWRRNNEIGLQFIDLGSRALHKELISQLSQKASGGPL